MPAFVAMVTMPFTFSIGYGIIAGLLLWTLGTQQPCNFLLFSWKLQFFTLTTAIHDMDTHLWAVSI